MLRCLWFHAVKDRLEKSGSLEFCCLQQNFELLKQCNWKEINQCYGKTGVLPHSQIQMVTLDTKYIWLFLLSNSKNCTMVFDKWKQNDCIIIIERETVWINKDPALVKAKFNFLLTFVSLDVVIQPFTCMYCCYWQTLWWAIILIKGRLSFQFLICSYFTSHCFWC